MLFRSVKPKVEEIKVEEPKVKVEEIKVEVEEPKVKVEEIKVEVEEPKVKVEEIKVEEPKVKVEEIKVEESKIQENVGLEREYVDTLPEVNFIKMGDVKSMEEELLKSPVIESVGIIQKIKCLDGSQWDTNEKRCISCDKYGLVWDSKYKACKIMLKEGIEKITKMEEDEEFNVGKLKLVDRKSTRLNSSHVSESRMPSSA